MITLVVNNKKRIIRDKFISYHTENDLHCTYKNHSIEINAQETGGYYIRVVDLGAEHFATVVDGYFNDFNSTRDNKYQKIEDCLREAIENIEIK